MPITVVTFDGTVDLGGWTKVGIAGSAHTGLDTVDQPASESSYVQAIGQSSGILKLSFPAGPPEIEKINYVRLKPFLLYGQNAANYPIILVRLVLNGTAVASASYDADTGADFEAKQVVFGPLNIDGITWTAAAREFWFSAYIATARYGNEPIPDSS